MVQTEVRFPDEMNSNVQEKLGGEFLNPSRGYEALTLLAAFAEGPKTQINCVNDSPLSYSQM